MKQEVDGERIQASDTVWSISFLCLRLIVTGSVKLAKSHPVTNNYHVKTTKLKKM